MPDWSWWQLILVIGGCIGIVTIGMVIGLFKINDIEEDDPNQVPRKQQEPPAER